MGWRRALHGLAALAVAATAACVPYVPKPISPAATAEAFASRRLDAPELAAFLAERAGITAWPPAAWDLRALTLAALYYSPELDVARARWAVARAGEVTAGVRPNPSATGALGYNASAVGVRPWIPEAVLDLPLETAGKRGIRRAEARQLSEAARRAVVAAAWEVRRAVRRAVVDLFVAGERAALLERERQLRQESVGILAAELKLGEVSPAEVATERIALDRTGLAALAATRQEGEARHRLAAALGVPAAAFEGAAFDFEALRRPSAEPPPAALRRQAVLGRSDLLAALAEYEASQAALRLEVARQYPDLDLGAGYQLDQTDSKWTLSLGLPLPVFHRNRGPIAEAEARRSEAAARFLALQAQVLAEVEAAAAAYAAVHSEVEAAERLVTSLTEQEETARAAYGLGEISRLERLGVELEHAAGEVDRLDVLAASLAAAGRLQDAIQSPLEVGAWVLETPERTSGEGDDG